MMKKTIRATSNLWLACGENWFRIVVTLALNWLNLAVPVTAITRKVPGGSGPEGDRWCVFVTFQRYAIPGYVLFAIKVLRRHGWNIILISNNRRLPTRSLAAVSPYVVEIVFRHNVGYDFGGYRDAIIHLRRQGRSVEYLLLTNDSYFGPLFDMSPLFDRVAAAESDIIGLIDSRELRYHYQSFWLIFKGEILRSTDFRRYWRRLKFRNLRWNVVRHHETGMLDHFRKRGYSCRVLFDTVQLARQVVPMLAERLQEIASEPAARPNRNLPTIGYDGARQHLQDLFERSLTGRPMNATVLMWEHLITEHRFPFLKKEVVDGSHRFPVWDRLVDALSDVGYPIRYIDEYLKSK